MKYNEIDMKNWKESDINTDSLWMITQAELAQVKSEKSK